MAPEFLIWNLCFKDQPAPSDGPIRSRYAMIAKEMQLDCIQKRSHIDLAAF